MIHNMYNVSILAENVSLQNSIQNPKKLALLKVRQSRNDFFKPTFPQKPNKQILLYYYETSGRLVFVRFLEEIEDTEKTFRN